MRRTFAVFFLALWPFIAAAQSDTLRLDVLGAKIDEYVSALERESAETKKAECDFMISSCKSDELRTFSALRLYGHYVDSKLMGDDAVAVHIARKWFLSGKVKMNSDVDLLQARFFVELNEASLIGCRAPSLPCSDPAGRPVELFGEGGPGPGRYTVLYFYDTSCSSCSAESLLLDRYAASCPYDVGFVAFYVGSDASEWKKYRESSLSNGAFTHLWDPEGLSDFPMKWAVLKTPRLYLVDPDGIIAGRGLDTRALMQLLSSVMEEDSYVYGSEESNLIFSALLEGEDDAEKAVGEVAALFAARTLQAGDTAGFKRFAGDYLYFLASRRGEGLKKGTAAFIERYILGEKFWTGRRDSSDVVLPAKMTYDLYQRAPVGSRIARLKVPGTLKKGNGKVRSGRFRLDRLCPKPAYIVFYTEGCGNCEKTLAGVDSLLSDGGNRRAGALLVNMDPLTDSDPELAEKLLSSFDLSSLPFVMETGRRGIIKRKYLDF